MCIAIFKPAGIAIPKSHLDEGQRRNPDGCGFSWVEDGKVQIFKSLSYQVFTEKYEEVIDRLGDISMLIHFRITSRGDTREDMCHPFKVTDDVAIIHNGTIFNISHKETAGGVSDTYILASDIMAGLPDGWIDNASTHRLLEEFIGKGSKVCIMHATGDTDADVYILNESGGYWDGDIWYSNKTYIVYKPVNRVHTTGAASNYNNSNNLPALYTQKQDGTWERNLTTTEIAGYNDYCDECFQETKYSLLKRVDGNLICPACVIKEERKTSAKLDEVFGQTTVYRPCAGCRVLTDKNDLYHLELEFISDLERFPHQLEAFQMDLMTPHAIYTDCALGFFCEDCYMQLMAEPTSLELIAVQVLELPKNVCEDLEKEINQQVSPI